MKFKTLVSLSIFLHASFSHTHTPPNRLVARDTTTEPDQGIQHDQCRKKVTDDDPHTNMINCRDDPAPVDLNECKEAGRLMVENKWSSARVGNCGVLYWGKDAHGIPVPFPIPITLTADIVVTTMNSFGVLCCPEETLVDISPAFVPPEAAVYCVGQLGSPRYNVPSKLTQPDINTLISRYADQYRNPPNQM